MVVVCCHHLFGLDSALSGCLTFLCAKSEVCCLYCRTKVVCLKPAGEAQVITRGPLAKRSKKESWAQWSLKRGMQSFPEAIAEYLQQSGRVQLHKEAVVKQIDPSASGWQVSAEAKDV